MERSCTYRFWSRSVGNEKWFVTGTLKLIARRVEAIWNRYSVNRGFIFTFFFLLFFFGSLTSTTCDDSLLVIETLSAEARNNKKTKKWNNCSQIEFLCLHPKRIVNKLINMTFAHGWEIINSGQGACSAAILSTPYRAHYCSRGDADLGVILQFQRTWKVLPASSPRLVLMLFCWAFFCARFCALTFTGMNIFM